MPVAPLTELPAPMLRADELMAICPKRQQTPNQRSAYDGAVSQEIGCGPFGPIEQSPEAKATAMSVDAGGPS